MHPVDQYRNAIASLPSGYTERANRAIGISNAIGRALQSGDRAGYDRAVSASVELGREQLNAYYRMTGRPAVYY